MGMKRSHDVSMESTLGVSTALCCSCGVPMVPNQTMLCAQCLKAEVSITDGISRSVVLQRCRNCGRNCLLTPTELTAPHWFLSRTWRESSPPEREESAKKQRCEPDKWVDGLLRYVWRDRLTVFSDPVGILARGVGNGMWSAGEVLSDYFMDNPEICRGSTCLELGSGIGVAGLTVASLGAELVVLTDLEKQMPLLQRNADANDKSGKVHLRALDWTQESHRQGLDPSLVVGSDVGYDPDLFGDLLLTLEAQCSEATTVYFALADREEEDEPNVQDFVDFVSGSFTTKVVHEGRAEPQHSLTKVLRMQKRPSRQPADALG
eukprot:s5023_g2.t1